MVLAAERLVTVAGVLSPGWVRLDGDKFHDLDQGAPPSDERVEHLSGAWVVPGFIDLHMHGGGGHDVTNSPEARRKAVRLHQHHGTTRTLVSLVTAPTDDLLTQLAWVADLADLTLGAHLKGPFLAPTACGAQNPAHLVAPDLALLEQLAKAARGSLRTITLAPELPHALALIAAAVAQGITIAVGHTSATYEQAVAAFTAGATLATHLCNAMPPIHHRSPGPVIAALQHAVCCEIVNDGVHVHPAITALVAEVRGRLALVTDAMSAAGTTEGRYRLGGQQVAVRDRQARLTGSGALAGSTLTMDEAFRLAVQASDLSIEAAAEACSTNPARVLGLEGTYGAMASGRCADLVGLDHDLRVTSVMRNGRWLLR